MRTFLTVLTFASLCRASNVEIGASAPPLTLTQLLQAPPGTKVTWESLKGNVVVLEFWATWCAGCRDQISHLNRLHEQFQNKPVRFLSLTDEEPDIVQRFVKDYPISGWIGLDSDEQTFKTYNIVGRPTTVLVDGTGTLRGIGNASDLTAEFIENLLTGKAITYSMEGTPAAKLQALPDPFYNAMLRPAGPVDVTGFSPGAISGKTGKSWNAWGLRLPMLLSGAYGVPENRIIVAAALTTARYDVALAAQNLSEKERVTLLRRTLEEAFQLKGHKESRETDVYVLQCRAGIKPKLRSAGPKGSSHWGKDGDITAVSVPLSFLVTTAERALGKSIVDETGLSNHFDFELKWDPSNPKSLIEAVRTQLDLELVSSQRRLDYFIVDSAVQPEPW
ncbi:MAG TPA: TIGR03435 family protein [Bryobacteraceae bacterium]|jgi:uncharacterized protein (TIGR03435 family)|nr:TIGR03435 family protein [Bryobacteraceae bacterium]